MQETTSACGMYKWEMTKMEKYSLRVVARQGDSNYNFDMTADRIPQVGEFILDRNSVYLVRNIMTRIGSERGSSVLIVEQTEPDEDLKKIMRELPFR